jgi:hypothetical protein
MDDDIPLCPEWWPHLLWRLHFPIKIPHIGPGNPVNYPAPINDILASLHIHTMSYLVEDKAAAQHMRDIAEKRIVELAGNLSNLHDQHFGKK